MTRRRTRIPAAVVVALALAALLAACGSEKAVPQGNATITIEGFEFAPNPMVVPVGSEVQVVNKDDTVHTLTHEQRAFDTGHIPAGKESVVKLSQAGEFPYLCAIHPQMRGLIRVRE